MPFSLDINHAVVFIFTIIMVAAFMHALQSYYLQNKIQAINFYCGTLTSLGILGTFIGIALGILYFDATIMDDSLLLMIEGFKTAFITSIIGLTLSILLKQITFIKPNTAITNAQKATPLSLLEHAIEKQTQSLSSFQDDLAKNIVKNLETVVTQFNKRIDKQFGENLKGFSTHFETVNTSINKLNKNILGFEEHVNALNIAVESTENMHAKGSDTLSVLIEKIKQANTELSIISDKNKINEHNFDQVQKANTQLIQVSEKICDQFDTFNTQLAQAAKTNNHNQKELTSALQVHLKNSQDTLIEAFNLANEKEIKANSALITELDKASQSQKELIAQIDKTLQLNNQANEYALKKADSLSQQVESIATTNEVFIKQAIDRFTKEFETIIHKQYNQFDQAHSNTHQAIQSALQKHDEKHQSILKQHYEQLDKQLNREMQQSLEQLGKIMGFVSGEFARDFQQLIDQMQSVKTEFSDQVIESHA